MKPYYLTRRAKIMFEADKGGVGAADSPTGAALPTASPGTSTSTIVQTEPASTNIISAKDALGLPESPSETIAGFQDRLRDRVDQTSVKLPAREKKEVKKEEPKVVVPPVIPVVETPTKIKYGGKEFTQEELTAHLAKVEADLAEAKKIKEPNPKPAAKVEPEPKKEIPAAGEEKTEAELDKGFIEARVSDFKPEDYGITADDLDVILSGGSEGVEQLSKSLGTVAARAELNARKWVERTMNPILAKLSPVIDQQEQIARYKSEQEFFTEHADLQPRQELVRQVAASLYSQDPEAASKMTQKDFNAMVAEYTRDLITKAGGTITPPAAASQTALVAQPVVTPVKTRPAPPTGQVGGRVAPAAENEQRRMAREIAEY